MAKLQRVWIKAVPEEWERRLAEFSPQTNRFTWLKIIWEQGYAWEPVERYMVYQMVPAHAVDPEILEQLQDPHPPSKHGNYYDSHFDNGDGTTGKFILNPDCLITERAWNMYRETGCWGRPYWVIQGTNGGHKRWFSKNEKKLLRLLGLPDEPAAPGDLPYAEFDEKCEANLRLVDVLKGAHSELRRRRALSTQGHEERESETEKAFRIQLMRFLADQVAEIAPDVHKGLVDSGAARMRGNQKAKEKFWEESEQDFIETGNSKSRLITIAK